MRRSQYRRASTWFSGRRRIVAAVATLVAFGGIVTVTQVSNASTRATTRALAACDSVKAPATGKSKWSTETKRGSYTSKNGSVRHHADDGAQSIPTTEQMQKRCRDAVRAGSTGAAGASVFAGEDDNNEGTNNNDGNNAGENNAGENAGENNNENNNNENNDNNDGDNNNAGAAPGAGLGVLANNCNNSGLEPHDGFQNGNRCISTQFGEVGVEGKNPTLLITEAPTEVQANQAFQLKVSTRNLVRDRFLAAGQGGYYVESSLLQGDGLVRGHFHTACRMLDNTNEAPESAPVPAFFVATEDGRGGGQPDEVTIQVPGLPENGTAQCASWAGDGSHRIPMMQRANQTPAFDAVRIQVGAGNNNNENNNEGDNNEGDNNGGNDGNVNAGAGQAEVKTINCPTVADKLPAIPASAQAEVMRNLALLENQIKESNARLVSSAGEGGANFVNNAILGPLKDKRGSTIDRIRISIERAGGQAPNDLGGLATCKV